MIVPIIVGCLASAANYSNLMHSKQKKSKNNNCSHYTSHTSCDHTSSGRSCRSSNTTRFSYGRCCSGQWQKHSTPGRKYW